MPAIPRLWSRTKFITLVAVAGVAKDIYGPPTCTFSAARKNHRKISANRIPSAPPRRGPDSQVTMASASTPLVKNAAQTGSRNVLRAAVVAAALGSLPRGGSSSRRRLKGVFGFRRCPVCNQTSERWPTGLVAYLAVVSPLGLGLRGVKTTNLGCEPERKLAHENRPARIGPRESERGNQCNGPRESAPRRNIGGGPAVIGPPGFAKTCKNVKCALE